MATYEVPSKAIITPAQLEQFQQSATHSRVLGYIEALNEAVVGVKLRDDCPESEVTGRRHGEPPRAHPHETHPCVPCRLSRPSLACSTMSRRLQSKRLRSTTPVLGSETLLFGRSMTELVRCVLAVPPSATVPQGWRPRLTTPPVGGGPTPHKDTRVSCRSVTRGDCVLPGGLGQPHSCGLWERHGTQLSLLAVSMSSTSAVPLTETSSVCVWITLVF
jgi:hypothetical protein